MGLGVYLFLLIFASKHRLCVHIRTDSLYVDRDRNRMKIDIISDHPEKFKRSVKSIFMTMLKTIEMHHHPDTRFVTCENTIYLAINALPFVIQIVQCLYSNVLTTIKCKHLPQCLVWYCQFGVSSVKHSEFDSGCTASMYQTMSKTCPCNKKRFLSFKN